MLTLPQRIRAGCDFLYSSPSCIGLLCHSAFVRVATRTRYKQAGLKALLCHSAFVRVATRRGCFRRSSVSLFATAHSCGLRRGFLSAVAVPCHLCHSAFVRVATFMLNHGFMPSLFATAHSCGLRLGVAGGKAFNTETLPQRIRAGCDDLPRNYNYWLHSLPQRIRAGCDYEGFDRNISDVLCHSAFVRVATCPFRSRSPIGAPLPQRIRAGCDGIQPPYDAVLRPLPQRIRAGCDQQGREFPSTVTLCHSAFVRVATGMLAGSQQEPALCHSAFVRVATGEKGKNCESSRLCHSAFVRVATRFSPLQKCLR